ncbi:MAG: PspC domain-containing protein [Lachnospiraceae bacterium]|nr:PspC domain-containing protein [Lachnospiraceae bacterium]
MEPKKLRRSTTDKVFAGVCTGVGRYFDLDPVLIRVIWACACIFFGTGLLAYIICAIVIPAEDTYNTYQ